MSRLRLPIDLQTDHYDIKKYVVGGAVTIEVPDEYLLNNANSWSLSEVICIQRLVALANVAIEINVIWGDEPIRQVLRSPSIFPLLAVLLCIDRATHFSGQQAKLEVAKSRKEIYEYLLQADLFSDVQILLCADNRGHGRPKALYQAKTGTLISRGDFESVIDTLLSTHTGYGIGSSKAVFFIQAIATIVAELFENTEIHGRLGLDKKPIAQNGLRGIVFKRIKISHQEHVLPDQSQNVSQFHRKKEIKEADALEISVFDSGVGFYSSYTRNELTSAVTVSEEWDVVHKCLERHYDDGDPNFRPSHRAMGLYEVLRALKMVNGILEVRSGRTYGYRTFAPGEMQFQLESSASSKRPNMPKPVLLDHTRKYVTVPTAHEYVVGSSIRVIIPLLK
jgi:hypothetical protein